MTDRPALPSPVREMPVLYKLIWTHLQETPGEVKIAEFAEQLGLSAAKTGTALNYMVELGAVIDLGPVVPDVPARGRPIRAYRVATSAELRAARPYQALPERER